MVQVCVGLDYLYGTVKRRLKHTHAHRQHYKFILLSSTIRPLSLSWKDYFIEQLLNVSENRGGDNVVLTTSTQKNQNGTKKQKFVRVAVAELSMGVAEI